MRLWKCSEAASWCPACLAGVAWIGLLREGGSRDTITSFHLRFEHREKCHKSNPVGSFQLCVGRRPWKIVRSEGHTGCALHVSGSQQEASVLSGSVVSKKIEALVTGAANTCRAAGDHVRPAAAQLPAGCQRLWIFLFSQGCGRALPRLLSSRCLTPALNSLRELEDDA